MGILESILEGYPYEKDCSLDMYRSMDRVSTGAAHMTVKDKGGYKKWAERNVHRSV